VPIPTSDYRGRPRWRHVTPVPNGRLIATVNGPGLGNYYMVGEAYAGLVTAYLPNRARVLDAGCGCGKLARFLRLNPTVERYVGFDVLLESVKWCWGAFDHVGDERFQFLHADVFSDVYNPSGKQKAAEYKFPAGDGEMNVVVAASLFTHLLEDECRRYLGESGRVLEKGGLLVASIHDAPSPTSRHAGDRARTEVGSVQFRTLAEGHGPFVQVDEVRFRQLVMVFRKV